MKEKRTFFKLAIFGGILIFGSLPLWLIFVEGNKDYSPWTRTMCIIIFLVGVVLLLLAGIVRRKFPDN